jgi:hypothetical protein
MLCCAAEPEQIITLPSSAVCHNKGTEQTLHCCAHMAVASMGRNLLTPALVVLQIVAAPPSLSITSLHVSHQMSYSISQVSPADVAACSARRTASCIRVCMHATCAGPQAAFLHRHLLQVGLQALTRLRTLRSLNLVSYGGRSHHCLDNRSFGCASCCLKDSHTTSTP